MYIFFRAGEYDPSKILDKIDNEQVRNMLSTMIQKDPQARKTANEHLCEQVCIDKYNIFTKKILNSYCLFCYFFFSVQKCFRIIFILFCNPICKYFQRILT